ncbi:MAG: pyridoxal phosphate-dependent aminotransferase [Nitrosopumilus sp.]|nr:pyridoxal phosphate-dependent aminotransferase [Nitrosopumilus sp.]MDA7943188.1 pyridoxal phosphate-dependent aminotransferase [Nitrosopumilus sp.]MDA7952417.1 pyridoxal phosphate-dependent aminotransferase [Nitrosopumilus sp.]MDA7957555.1 pyridoxal phosphate-dependent aminotransferase [Nitrosopumilus sp.]MDA7959583.1 pyridoxal phosphate-dependent aminotransferase [Nitrosopumilus sp.]
MRFVADQQVEDIEMPENLKLNTFLQEFHSDCHAPECRFGLYGFAFGQSPFHVPAPVREALCAAAGAGSYAAVPGIPELREAISRYNRHYFGFDAAPERVYVGPGTKELMFNLLEILHGTVILPTPAWLGYLPQIRYLKKNFHMLPARASGRIHPGDLRRLALRLHDRQKILILNNPNNPTGLIYGRRDLEEIAAVCREQNIAVISDEIYAQTAFDPGAFTSMGRIYPEGTFVTNGLSKSHAAGGYRLGYVVFPHHAQALRAQFKKILATEYTAVSTPVQHAAVAGFEPGPKMDEYFATARAIHRIMAEYTHRELCSIDGVRATRPEATFYLLADFNALSGDLARAGITTSQQLSEALIVHPYHTAIVGGDSLVLERTDLSARIAYVDYDGEAAFARYAEAPPRTAHERTEFAERCAPRVAAGIRMMARFLADARAGRLAPEPIPA